MLRKTNRLVGPSAPFAHTPDIGPQPVKTAQVSPDRPWVGLAAIGLVFCIMLASYVFSFAAISASAEKTGNPPATFWLAAVFIDGPILTYTVSYVVQAWRGGASRRTLWFLYLFTAISVYVNFAHTAGYWKWDLSSPSAWTGIAIAVSAPIGALLASEEVVILAFQRRTRRPVLVAEDAAAVDEAQPQDVPDDVAPGSEQPHDRLAELLAFPSTPHPGADDDLDPA